MTFQTEFPNYAAADMPAIPAGWVDISWHNDSCPGFSATPEALAGTGVSIWADYKNPADREIPESPRFTVYMTDAEGNQIADFSTDDWAELLAKAELFAHRWVLISLLQGQIDDETQAVEFITALHVTGCSYHFEDDATECLAGIDWLTDADREAIRDIVALIYTLDCWTAERCPCAVALEVSATAAGFASWEEMRDGKKPVEGSDREALTQEFAAYCNSQPGFDEGDAMDLLHRDDLTADQRRWLSDFVIRWDAMEANARAK